LPNFLDQKKTKIKIEAMTQTPHFLFNIYSTSTNI